MSIIVKSAAELAIMRQAGKIVADILDTIKEQIKPSMKTREIDAIAEKELQKAGATSAFKGYRGYPASVCVSVNDQIVHGIPGDRVLREGDIVSLDFGAVYRGFTGDAALTVPVGKASEQANKLIEATREALDAGIAAAKNGARLGDVSSAIQHCAEARGYQVVREYTGHGIGREMHEEPQIPNFGTPDTGPVLKKGMTICLEPMLNMGDWRTRLGEDYWTVYTADGSLSAHFEHTIAITDGQAEVLTDRIYA